MKIVLAPFSRMPNGAFSAKCYPWFKELIALMPNDEFVQVSGKGEPRIEGVGMFLAGFPLKKVEDVIRDADTWLSIDSWMPHFCATMRLQRGVVIWALSNPAIWGYPQNVNLLKDAKYLRADQYVPWFDVPYNEDAFVAPEVVMDALHGLRTPTA